MGKEKHGCQSNHCFNAAKKRVTRDLIDFYGKDFFRVYLHRFVLHFFGNTPIDRYALVMALKKAIFIGG